MKLGHHTALVQITRSPVLAALGLLLLGSACSAPASDSTPIEGLEQSLRSARSSAASKGPARGHHRGRRHGGRHHGGGDGGGGGGAVTPCGPQDQDALFQLINFDLAQTDADDRPFQRYLTLSDRAHVVGCGAALDGDRAALTKLINSLSINASLEQPLAVDADLTVYRVDLRDFDWDRAISVGGVRFADAWEAVVANDPYAVPYIGDDADDAVSDTGTSVPVLFGSTFLAAASQAPLYYGLLDIPADVDDFLLNDLAIDVAQDLADQETVRAGFVADVQGGEAEFLAERFDIEVRAGVVWQISEFGRGSVFEDPLGSARGERELVFTLPNGLQGHIVADGNGRVRNASNLLLDVTNSGFLAQVATSFFASRAQGVQLQDEVRPFVLANPTLFSAAERAAILEIYPGARQLQQVLADDRNGFFARGLQLIGLDIDDSPEPISQSFTNFSADVDLETAASELFVTPQDLEDNLDLLDPVLSVLARGQIDRDDFTQLYVNSLCILSVVLENQPDVLVCDAAAAP